MAEKEMDIHQNSHLHQSQGFFLTPALKKSLDILQMPTLNLTQLIQECLLNNPFLQGEEENGEDRALFNGKESPDLPSHYWENGKKGGRFKDPSSSYIEESVSSPLSLKEHLRTQLQTRTTNHHTLWVGTHLIDYVEQDGLIRIDMDEIANDLNIQTSDILPVLSLLQECDPVGVCARSIEESFTLQLRETNRLTPSLLRILNHLKTLEKGVIPMVKAAKVSEIELKEAIQILRTLTPKPGESFQNLFLEPMMIDVFVKRGTSGQWGCELNEASLPKVYVNSTLYHTLRSKKLKREDSKYLASQISSANGFIRSIHQRSETILKVCQALVSYQHAFFEKGSIALKPMGLKWLAEETGMHESTISRCIHQKYLHTPWGIFELKYFLGSSVQNDSQSNRSIQAMIKTLICKENKKSPLPDEELCDILEKNGVSVARRTIAKYRKALNIPSSLSRKKQAQLMTF